MGPGAVRGELKFKNILGKMKGCKNISYMIIQLVSPLNEKILYSLFVDLQGREIKWLVVLATKGTCLIIDKGGRKQDIYLIDFDGREYDSS